jgi:muramoyltetrapeptide carboxypeptidase
MAAPLKPPALQPGAQVRVISLSSPVERGAFDRGLAELARLGFNPQTADHAREQHGYFSGTHHHRWTDLTASFVAGACDGVICTRGGYGSTYLLDLLDGSRFPQARVFVGHSDVTAVQAFLWQKLGWVTFYGPMVAAGFDKGAAGYDEESFRKAVSNTSSGWRVNLRGDSLVEGTAEGVVLGGCLTMLQTTLGTPWELDTTDAILLLEDRGMKPFQVDRALMHLRQAGKFAKVRGVIFGEFPECEAPAGSEDVRSIALRLTADLRVPVVFGAAVGHTPRPMLTLPLGVRARLESRAAGLVTDLFILEPAVV